MLIYTILSQKDLSTSLLRLKSVRELSLSRRKLDWFLWLSILVGLLVRKEQEIFIIKS